MTACVHIVHKRCGSIIAVAVPESDGVLVVTNENIVEGLDEIRKADSLPSHGQKRLVVGFHQRYPTAAAMPSRFSAWCTGCAVECHIDRRRIAGKVSEVRDKGEDRKLHV